MGQSHTSTDLSSPIIAAPDPAGQAVIARALASLGIPPGEVLRPSGKAVYGTLRRLDGFTGLLIAAPSPKLGSAQFTLIDTVLQNGGAVIIWRSDASLGQPGARDQWLADQLAAQTGAPSSTRLSAIARAAALFPHLRRISTDAVAVAGPTNSLKRHLLDTLTHLRVPVARGKSPLVLEVKANGDLTVLANGRAIIENAFPDDIGEALSLLLHPKPVSIPSGEAVHVNLEDLYLFLQPPARLLSETASKKLTRLFGIASPSERLCKSPSEAVRIAKSIGGPTVFKLVKPKLEDKASVGAVITDVAGPAAARQAVHALSGLGISLGPPKALGILVCEQVADGPRIWLRMETHPRFGRLIVGGPGDTPAHRPAFVLRVPADAESAHRAIQTALPDIEDGDSRKLAAGTARFSHLVDRLGDHIDRAEIHPLAAGPHLEEALALDALIAVTG